MQMSPPSQGPPPRSRHRSRVSWVAVVAVAVGVHWLGCVVVVVVGAEVVVVVGSWWSYVVVVVVVVGATVGGGGRAAPESLSSWSVVGAWSSWSWSLVVGATVVVVVGAAVVVVVARADDGAGAIAAAGMQRLLPLAKTQQTQPDLYRYQGWRRRPCCRITLGLPGHRRRPAARAPRAARRRCP